MKEADVELFSNISGLIYKEFIGDDVGGVFEDVRVALEALDASTVGQVVRPGEEGSAAVAAVFEAMMDKPKQLQVSLVREMWATTEGLPDDLKVERISTFLRQRKSDAERRVNEMKALAENKERESMATPNHDGLRLAAMFSAISIAPFAAEVDLSSRLLDELAFCERHDLGAAATIDRLKAAITSLEASST